MIREEDKPAWRKSFLKGRLFCFVMQLAIAGVKMSKSKNNGIPAYPTG